MRFGRYQNHWSNCEAEKAGLVARVVPAGAEVDEAAERALLRGSDQNLLNFQEMTQR